MPKISVNEKDLSWYYRQRATSTLTVYLPGVSTFGPEDKPVLCNSSNFATTFGTAIAGVGDISYNMAASYIKSGLNVIFHRFVSENATRAIPSDRAEQGHDIGDSTNSVDVSAKYKGSYLNGAEVVLAKGSGSVWQVFVYAKNRSSLLETITVNFKDPLDSNYVDSVDSQYIEFDVTGDASKALTESSYTFTLAGGADHEKDVTSDKFKKEIHDAIATAGSLDELKDPYQFSFDIVQSAGWCDFTDVITDDDVKDNPALIKGIEKVDMTLFNLAKSRAECVFFVDGRPKKGSEQGTLWDYNQFYTYCGLFNSSFAVGVGPWGYARFVNNGALCLLPGSYALTVSWANSCASGNPVWMAPAGVKRSTLGSFYKDTEYVVGKAVLDAWQNHDLLSTEPLRANDYKVIPIMKAKQYGYVVYGNSTLLQNLSDGASSMLQSLSTRVLANLIKKKSFDISLSLQFDQMSDELFVQFKTLLSEYMEQLRYQGALYSYEIIADRSAVTRTNLNEKTVPVTIRISPNPAAENFDITLEISQAGVSFSDTAGENETV